MRPSRIAALLHRELAAPRIGADAGHAVGAARRGQVAHRRRHRRRTRAAAGRHPPRAAGADRSARHPVPRRPRRGVVDPRDAARCVAGRRRRGALSRRTDVRGPDRHRGRVPAHSRPPPGGIPPAARLDRRCRGQPPGRSRHHLPDARAPGEPLRALRGRGGSRRLGRLGACHGCGRAGHRVPALPSGSAVRLRSPAPPGGVSLAALVGIRQPCADQVRRRWRTPRRRAQGLRRHGGRPRVPRVHRACRPSAGSGGGRIRRRRRRAAQHRTAIRRRRGDRAPRRAAAAHGAGSRRPERAAPTRAAFRSGNSA